MLATDAADGPFPAFRIIRRQRLSRRRQFFSFVALAAKDDPLDGDEVGSRQVERLRGSFESEKPGAYSSPGARGGGAVRGTSHLTGPDGSGDPSYENIRPWDTIHV